MIFKNSLPGGNIFFACLSLPASTLLTLTRFLVASLDGLPSASEAADSIRTEARHRAQLVRFLAREGWSRNWNTLTTLAAFLMQSCQHEVGTWVFLLDQTYHTTFGRHAQNTFSHANKTKRTPKSKRRQKKAHTHSCHCFVFGLLISPETGTRLPMVRSYYTKEYIKQLASEATPKRPAPTFRTQTDLAAQMILQLRLPRSSPVLVLGDTAFEAQQIREACEARGFDWIVPSNPERVLAGRKKRIRVRDYRTSLDVASVTPMTLSPGLNDWWRHQRGSRAKAWLGQYARRYWALSETLTVHNVGTVNVVFSSTEKPQEGRHASVQKILFTNRLDWSVQKVVAAYAVRWQIENCQPQYPSSARWGVTARIDYH